MGVRNYSNLAANTTASGSVASAAPGASTVIVVGSVTGWPSAPFTISIERGTANEEICLVTARTGTSLTCTRGYDGTSPVAHASGSVVEHVTASLDYSEANAHVNTTTNAHVQANNRYIADRVQAQDTHLLTSAADIALAPFKVGSDTGAQLLMDPTNIQSNSAANTPAPLYLNPFGGDVFGGGATDDEKYLPAPLVRNLQRMETTIMGGGVMTWSLTAEFGWNARFIAMGQGRNATYWSVGYFEILQPPAGTVVPVHSDGSPSVGPVTVTSAGIPIPTWCSLYYELPLGSIQTSLPANFHLVYYSPGATNNFTPPAHWVKLATHNTTDHTLLVLGRYYMKLASTWDASWGAEDLRLVGTSGVPAFANGWTNYGGVFRTAGFCIDSQGWTHITGLVKSGTVSATLPIFTLPTGYRPEMQQMFPTVSNSAFARFDVLTSGAVCATFGSNAWFNIDCSFKALEV